MAEEKKPGQNQGNQGNQDKKPISRREFVQKQIQSRVDRNKRLVESPDYTAISTKSAEAIDLSYLITSMDIGLGRLRDNIGRSTRYAPEDGLAMITESQKIIDTIDDFNTRLYKMVGMKYQLPIRLKKKKEEIAKAQGAKPDQQAQKAQTQVVTSTPPPPVQTTQVDASSVPPVDINNIVAEVTGR